MKRWLKARFRDVIDTGKDYRVNCPFCRARHGRADTKNHLYIGIQKPKAHCFRCGWRGHWVNLVMNVEGCNYAEALSYIQLPRQNVIDFDSLSSPMGLVQTDSRTLEPPGFVPIYWEFVKDGREASAVNRYLRKRIRGAKHYKDWMSSGRFGYVSGSNRVWILVDEYWWQGRSITDMEPKYLFPDWPMYDSLWNATALYKYNHIYVCEGVFSAIHAGPNAVALCGKSINDAQARRVANSTADVITVLLDADAVDESYKVASALVRFGYAGDIRLWHLDRGDPCDGMEGKAVPYDLLSVVEYHLH